MVDFVALCYRGDFDKVREGVERGVDVNSVDSEGYSGLMRAMSQGHNEIVRWLLRLPATDIRRKNTASPLYGFSALHMAAMSNNPGGLSMLVSHPNADLTERDRAGKTPLDYCR